MRAFDNTFLGLAQGNPNGALMKGVWNNGKSYWLGASDLTE